MGCPNIILSCLWVNSFIHSGQSNLQVHSSLVLHIIVLYLITMSQPQSLIQKLIFTKYPFFHEVDCIGLYLIDWLSQLEKKNRGITFSLISPIQLLWTLVLTQLYVYLFYVTEIPANDQSGRFYSSFDPAYHNKPITKAYYFSIHHCNQYSLRPLFYMIIIQENKT